MRKIVLAVLAAFALSLGLTVTAGTAFAATCPPGQHPDAAGACVADTHPGHPFPGRPFPGHPGFPVGGHFNDRLNGRYIVLDGGPQLDVCSAPDYTAFVSRYGTYRNRFDGVFGPNPSVRFVQLHQSDCSSSNTTVVDNGNCTTVTTDYQNYNNAVRDWNDVALRARGLRIITPALRVQLDAAARDRDRWRGAYLHDNQVRTTTNTTCQAPTTINNITVQAAPTSYVAPSAPATVTEQAPAPVYVAPQAAPVVPNTSSGIHDGDGSVALEQW
jgi:hypothetical protein